jgi:hypothetical protein
MQPQWCESSKIAMSVYLWMSHCLRNPNRLPFAFVAAQSYKEADAAPSKLFFGENAHNGKDLVFHSGLSYRILFFTTKK